MAFQMPIYQLGHDNNFLTRSPLVSHIQYIQSDLNTVFLCFALLWVYYEFLVDLCDLPTHINLGWGYWTNFLRSVIFLIFQNHQNTCYLCNITFIFDRCQCSWAAETPDKYERDLKYLTYVFDKSKFPVTEKLTNGDFVTPTSHP